MEEQHSSFEGWAIVEMMGHRREVGYVTTQWFGSSALIRIDTPELLERDRALDRPEYLHTNIGYKTLPVGTVVRRPAMPARSILIGVPSIYAINPCTEDVAKEAIEKGIDRPLICLSIPQHAQITAPKDIDVTDLNRYCDECGYEVMDCHCP